MPQTLEQMTPDLLALTEADRGRALDMLIESLGKPPGVWSEDDPGLEAELARRLASIEDGTAVLIPYEQVKAELDAMLAE